MKLVISAFSAAVLVAITALQAGAQSPIPADPSKMDHSKMGHGAAPATAATADLPSTAAYKAASDKMHAAMTIPYTGNADVDFAKGMIPHHQGAVEMARVILQHGKDPQLRKLARDIIKAQDKEIAFMQRWLAKKGKS
jgi:uncharacterized protein (DUF305 family)